MATSISALSLVRTDSMSTPESLLGAVPAASAAAGASLLGVGGSDFFASSAWVRTTNKQRRRHE